MSIHHVTATWFLIKSKKKNVSQYGWECTGCELTSRWTRHPCCCRRVSGSPKILDVLLTRWIQERTRKERWLLNKSGKKLFVLPRITLRDLLSPVETWARMGIIFPCFKKVPLCLTLWEWRNMCCCEQYPCSCWCQCWVWEVYFPKIFDACCSQKLKQNCRHFRASLLWVLHSSSICFSFFSDSHIIHDLLFYKLVLSVLSVSWSWHQQSIVFQWIIYLESLQVVWSVNGVFSWNHHGQCLNLVERSLKMRCKSGLPGEATLILFLRNRHKKYSCSVHLELKFFQRRCV